MTEPSENEPVRSDETAPLEVPTRAEPTNAELRGLLQLVVVLQVVIIAVVVVVFLQLDGLPSRTAELVPDNTGSIDGGVDQLQQQVTDLSLQVTRLQRQVEAIQSALP